jgi:hypothetical protein
MSKDDIRPILCGKCQVTPERGFERDGELWAACPVCGNEDRIVDIQREAAEQFATKSIGDMLAGIGGGRLTVKRAPARQYRRITGDYVDP